MLKAVAVVIVPVQVLNVLITLSLPDTSTTAGATTTTSDSEWAGIAALLLIFVINVVSSALAQAACLKAVSDTYLGTETDWRGSLRFGFRRLGSLLWLTLIHGVLVLLGFAACIVPGVWLYVAWSVAVPVLLIEGTRGFRALGRSFNLVRRRWWPTAGILLLANLLATAVAAGTEAVTARWRAVAGQVDPDQARDQARQILGGRRYKPAHVPRPFQGALEWLGDRLRPIGDFFSRITESLAGKIALAAVLAGVVAVVALLVARRRAAASAAAGGGGRRSPDEHADP